MQQLQQLQQLHLNGLNLFDALPTLAKLTQLSSLTGRWQTPPAAPQAGAAGAMQLTAVRHLAILGGYVPFSAFPAVQTVMYSDTCSPNALLSLSQHCKSLQALTADATWDKDTNTLAPTATAEERTAAVASLAALPQLHSLFLAVNDNAEVSALAVVSQLQQLTLFVPYGSRITRGCSAMGLASLALLRNLQLLELQLPGLFIEGEAVCGMISSMQCIQSVEMCVMPGDDDEVSNGLELALARHIRVPASFKITYNKKWSTWLTDDESDSE
jgi:hypothetical protein